MKIFIFLVSMIILAFSNEEMDKKAEQKIDNLQKPLYNPFIERYIIDELKNLRQDQQNLRVELTQNIAKSKLEVSDRAMRYVTDTVNNIFFIITAVASLIAIFGYKSLNDAKKNTEFLVKEKVEKVIEKYDKRLSLLEKQMKEKSEQIIENQKSLAIAGEIDSLWKRSEIEDNQKNKLELYDKIIEIDPENIEAITKKADIALELGEKEWSFNLSNRALEIDDKYAYAYWQRACSSCELGNLENALSDIKTSLNLSPYLKESLADEQSFENLKDNSEFQELINS
jgi:tetratricopeptide (TPR) repeat protein